MSNTTSINKYKIPGYSQLFLETTCGLSCKNCCVFDYKGTDATIGLRRMTISNTRDFLVKMREKGIGFTRLVTLGGEPTLNPDFKEISYMLRNEFSDLYDDNVCHTNGCNLTSDVIEGLSMYDAIHISIYPSNIDIHNTLINSDAIKYLRTHNTNVIFKMYTKKRFFAYGEKRSGFTYDENNWDRCPIKNQCQYIHDGNIYGCNLLFAEKREPCNLMTSTVQEIHDYFERESGYEMCKTCWQPAKEVAVLPNKPEIDKSTVTAGLKLISLWNKPNKII